MALELEAAQWTDNVFEETSLSPSYYSSRGILGSSNLEVFVEEEHDIDGVMSSSGGILTTSTATTSTGSASSPPQLASNGNGAISMRRTTSNSTSSIGLKYNGEPISEFVKNYVGVCYYKL